VSVLALALLAAGCDWYGIDEVAIRAVPYPYNAAVAVDDGSAPVCLGERGVVFAFEGESVRTVGQDAACSLIDRGRQLWETLAFLYSEREWRGAAFFANRLFEPRGADGGAVIYSYKRYVGSITDLPRDMPDEVAASVAEAVAYELSAKGGVMLLAGRTNARRGPGDPVIDHIRVEHGRGRIWYTGRDRLLSYSFLRRYLEWSSTQGDDGFTIHVRSVDDGAHAPWVPARTELAGLTFYTPDPSRTRVLLAGEELLDVTANPADWTRRGSVTIGSLPDRPGAAG
jgi:hypothetical protein